mgnify:CR=1 FL=1|jgi:hypothetical protein
MKTPSLLAPFLLLAACLVLPLAAKEKVPSGFVPLSEYQEALAKAGGKKLVVLVVKGLNDDCPNCVAAMDHGEKAIGSGVVKVFARAETIGDVDSVGFTPALKDRVAKRFSTGASVSFVVFNPDMTSIIAEASRDELQDDKDATTAFKKKVQEAKKALK